LAKRGRRADFANDHARFVGGFTGRRGGDYAAGNQFQTGHPLMNSLLYAFRPLLADLGATLIFVLISAVTHNPLIATGLAMAYGVGQVIWLKMRREPVAALQWMGLGLVVIFGTATLLTKNAVFMMIKPSIIYVLIAVVMLRRGWMLRYMPPQGRGLADAAMIRWGYVWSGLMFVTAVLNLGFALFTSLAVWGAFSAIFLPSSKIVLFAVQYLSVRATAIKAARAAGSARPTAEAVLA
jgi:intracellular septation protein